MSVLSRPLLLLAALSATFALVVTAGWYRDHQRLAHIRAQYARNADVMFHENVDLSRQWSRVQMPANLTRTPCPIPDCIGSWASPEPQRTVAREIQAAIRHAGLTPTLRTAPSHPWSITAAADEGLYKAYVATSADRPGSLRTIAVLPQRPLCQPGESPVATNCALHR